MANKILTFGNAGSTLGILMMTPSLPSQALEPVHAKARPNIIVILTDDMGFGDVGCYGGKFAPTPCIDRMAAEGLRFMQYYSASPSLRRPARNQSAE